MSIIKNLSAILSNIRLAHEVSPRRSLGESGIIAACPLLGDASRKAHYFTSKYGHRASIGKPIYLPGPEFQILNLPLPYEIGTPSLIFSKNLKVTILLSKI